MASKIPVESIVGAGCLLAATMIYLEIGFGEQLVVMTFATLALYYLLSAAHVLFNKMILQSIRLTYFIGLWCVMLGLIGAIFKLRFWPYSPMLLVVSVSTGLTVLIFSLALAWLWRKQGKPELSRQIAPIAGRLLGFLPVFLMLYLWPNAQMYGIFGRHRSDAEHTRLLLRTLESPQNEAFRSDLLQYLSGGDSSKTKPPYP